MKVISNRYLFALLMFLLGITAIASTTYSANYCVDQNHLSASDSNPGTEGLPWKHAWYGARQLATGDTLIIKTGYYFPLSDSNFPDSDSNLRPMISPNAGVDNVTIEASGDVTLAGGIVDASNESFDQPVVGITNNDGFTLDGFKVFGQVGLYGGTGAVVKNNDICECGADADISQGGSIQGECIRVENMSNVTIQNNNFHDVSKLDNITAENTSCILTYNSNELYIYQNTFDNAIAYGVRLKDNPQNMKIYRNLFKNCYFAAIGAGTQDMGQGVEIYENIIINCFDGVYARNYVDGIKIYNNVIYNSSTEGSLKMTNPQHVEWYNNIIYTDDIFVQPFSSSWLSYSMDYLDYNNYFGSGVWRVLYETKGTSLSKWKTYLAGKGYSEFDANSIDSDPKFVDPLNEDFRLQNDSPCKGTGRDGLDMGAYPNGDDGTIIGYVETGGKGLPDEPQHPENPRIQ